MSDRLLLVEDDKSLGYILKEYLELNDFQVNWARDGEEGLSIFKENDFDLCILDIMMPKKDGFALAREMQEMDRQTPFIFLTAKTLKVDKLKAFNMGADDYIVKPVDEELLIARIRAIIRRYATSSSTSTSEDTVYTIGSYTFNYETRSISRNGDSRTLTEREADLLLLLCKQKSSILKRDEALRKIWGESDYFNRRIMDVYISKLRKYLSEDPSIKIENVHGKGFILKDNG